MTKKHAVIFSIIIHIIIAAALIILKFERKKTDDRSPVELEYTFIERPEPVKEDKSDKTVLEKPPEIPLPPVELPVETSDASAAIIASSDTSIAEVQSLVIMPGDTLSPVDSIILEDPGFLALSTVFMERVRNNVPQDTSKKWKRIMPVGMDEYLNAMKFKDGFNNAKMQEDLNSGGIKIPLDAIFDLFD